MQVSELKASLKTVLSESQIASLIAVARSDSGVKRRLELLAGGLSQPALVGAIKQHLVALLPDDTDDELSALLSTPLPSGPAKTPRKPAKTSKRKTATSKPAKPAGRTLGKAKPTAQPTAPAGKTDWIGQAPISESTGNPLPWWQSSATGKDGNTYYNFGRKGYGKSIGCTLEVWRELLSNAAELLADLEDFAS